MISCKYYTKATYKKELPLAVQGIASRASATNITRTNWQRISRFRYRILPLTKTLYLRTLKSANSCREQPSGRWIDNTVVNEINIHLTKLSIRITDNKSAQKNCRRFTNSAENEALDWVPCSRKNLQAAP